MLGRLFLLFTLVPLLELLLLIEVGERIGAGPTVALVLATGVVGAWLARREGTRSWRTVRRELGEGKLPAEEMLGAVLVLVAGAFLVTPGILTDAAGLLLLARPVRSRITGRIRRRLEARLEEGAIRVFTSGSVFGPGAGGSGEPERPGDGEEGGDGWYRRGPSGGERPSPGEGGGARGEEAPGADREDEPGTDREGGHRIIDV